MLKNIFTSIDIGSNNIKVVVCELHNNKLNLLAASSVSSKGIKRGMIVNADEASKSIKEAFEKVGKKVAAFAENEGLDAHANSAKIRYR